MCTQLQVGMILPALGGEHIWKQTFKNVKAMVNY